jgi:hypothetical protein
MADLAAHISDAIGAPVIDGVSAATRTVESLVALGLRTGSRGEFAAPPAKPYTGTARFPNALTGYMLSSEGRSSHPCEEIGSSIPGGNSFT